MEVIYFIIQILFQSYIMVTMHEPEHASDVPSLSTFKETITAYEKMFYLYRNSGSSVGGVD